jgi:serine/threonine-protein kinase
LLAGSLGAGALLGASLAAAAFRRQRARLERELADARRIGNWRLEERLGRGGMGEVWRASHVFLPRPAAVKFIRPEALGGGDAATMRDVVRRFRCEARAVASLTSPHTIQIFDFGVAEDGTLCHVMEFLEGMDLETLVRSHGPLPPARAVHLLRQVCISLAEAHQEGLVHRDLKPANIYSCRKGIQHDFVKVLDFGMVADLDGRIDAERSVETGGTPSYIAPEVATGRGCDARSDLYSLGCVAYFLLTGATVFGGSTPQERIAHHVHSRPEPPSRRAPHPVPRDLDLAVLACLAKNPDERPSSAAALSRRLAACDVGPAWTSGQAAQWWRTRPAAPAAAPATATAGRDSGSRSPSASRTSSAKAARR